MTRAAQSEPEQSPDFGGEWATADRRASAWLITALDEMPRIRTLTTQDSAFRAPGERPEIEKGETA
jgi:hypothetical protein